MIYKNWLNDTRLDCINITQGFFKDFFEVENVLLDYNEQLFFNVGVYEKEWWVIITLNSLKFDVGYQCTNGCSWRYLKLYTFEDWTSEYFGVNWFFCHTFVCKSSISCFLFICCEYSVLCKVCFLVFVLGLLLQKVYEIFLLSFDNPFVFKLFV